MTQHMDAFLRNFIGYGQDQITKLTLMGHTQRRTHHRSPARLSGLGLQAPDGDMKVRPMTEEARRADSADAFDARRETVQAGTRAECHEGTA